MAVAFAVLAASCGVSRGDGVVVSDSVSPARDAVAIELVQQAAMPASRVETDQRVTESPLVELGIEDENGCVRLAPTQAEVAVALQEAGLPTDEANRLAALADGSLSADALDAQLRGAFAESKSLPRSAEWIRGVAELLANPTDTEVCPGAGSEGDLEPGSQDQPVRLAGAGDRLGYFGPYFATTVVDSNNPEMLVLSETVTAGLDPDGQFVIRGLVANDRSLPVGMIEIAIAGLEQKFSASVPVALPGEPVPFEAVVPGYITTVQSIDVVGVIVNAARQRRTLDIDPLWQLSAGDRERFNSTL